MKKLALGVWVSLLMLSACTKETIHHNAKSRKIIYDMECMKRTPYNMDTLGHFLVDTVTFSAVWKLLRINDSLVMLNDSIAFEATASGIYVSFDVPSHATMVILNDDSININLYAPGHFSSITGCMGVKRY